jgi:hypothetical protein
VIRRPRPLSALVLAVAACAAAPSAAQAAEQLAGVTADNQLYLFRSDSPGNLQNAVPITGLQSNEQILGVDSLAATGRLYALGSTNRIYVIDPLTGVATPITNTPFSPPLNGTAFAFSIDPGTLVARSISSTQNLRISVATGQVAGVDPAYAYDPSDAGTGTTPVFGGIAYSVPPAGSGGVASLYGIDTSRDTLITAPTQAALVRTIGPLGFDADGQTPMDLTAAGIAYAALHTGNATPSLYTVDLSTGAAKATSGNAERSTIAFKTSSTSRAVRPILMLAALGEVPDDTTDPRVLLAAPNSIKASNLRSRGYRFSVSCSEACSVSARLTVGRERMDVVTGDVLATAGYVRMTAKLDAAAKKLLREDSTQGFGLRVSVTDSAGNRVTTSRSGRTR